MYLPAHGNDHCKLEKLGRELNKGLSLGRISPAGSIQTPGRDSGPPNWLPSPSPLSGGHEQNAGGRIALAASCLKQMQQPELKASAAFWR